MKTLAIIVLSIGTTLGLSSAAGAETINFKAMADGAFGESAWTSLDLTLTDFSVSVTGSSSAGPGYAYLDSGNAGLGVCGVLDGSPSANAIHPGSTANLCAPS